MEKITAAAKTVWKCLNLKKKEKALVICDENRLEIGKVLWYVGKEKCRECVLLGIKEGKVDGEEPPKEIERIMKGFDVITILTRFSLTHTKAVRNSVNAGTRIASMPGITKDVFLRIPANYSEIRRTGEKIRKMIGNEIRVKTRLGTDLVIYRDGREVYNSCGHLKKPGIINLPDGEVFFAPQERKSEGKVIIDLLAAPSQETKFGKIGKVKKPFAVVIEKGRAVKVENEVLRKWIFSVKNGNILCEFGIGTNHTAKIKESVLEGEKVQGTSHIAFGSNTGFGGKNRSEIHLDCVFDKPTIYSDGKEIIRNGRLNI